MKESTQTDVVTLKRRRTAFQNARFRVFADHIADSQGNEVEDFLVVVPRSQRSNLLTGVAVIPVQDNQIMLLNSYRHVVGRRVIELPRGFLDENEEPAWAALRELSEETGLTCEPNRLFSLGTLLSEPGVLSARVALFAAMECRPGGQRLNDEIGIDEGLWFPVAEVRRMLLDFEIEEASTCSALHRYFSLIDRDAAPRPSAGVRGA